MMLPDSTVASTRSATSRGASSASIAGRIASAHTGSNSAWKGIATNTLSRTAGRQYESRKSRGYMVGRSCVQTYAVFGRGATPSTEGRRHRRIVHTLVRQGGVVLTELASGWSLWCSPSERSGGRMPARACWRARVLGLALLAGSAQAQVSSTAPESRLALVIGNSAYKQSPLANAVADARLMDTVLREAGFEVVRAENASLREMRRLVRDFGERLQRSKGVGLFYFAGHGVQLRGENYLISVDSDIRNEDEVPDDSVSAALVLEKLESAGNRMNILVLDACRNNPFASRTRSTAAGLATMNAPAGTLIAYATAPGAVAFDGSGRNGLYTRHLADAIRQPGLRVEEVFKTVRAAVRRASNNQQTPWENTALEGEFFFRAPLASAVAAAPAAAPAAAGPNAAAFELSFWESIRNSNRRADFEEYLRQFPQGRFAGLARNRLAAVEAPSPAAKAAAPPGAAADTLLAAVQPPAPAAVAAAAAATAALPDIAPGDRYVFRDSDPFTRAEGREFVRVVTRVDGDEIEFDGGLLTLRRGSAGRVGRGGLAELLSGPVPGSGGWTARYVPASGQGDPVEIRLRFERSEARTIGGRTLQLVRAAASGFGPNQGIPGRPESFNAAIRGHVVLEPDSGIVVEMVLTSDNPAYALRRQLVSIDVQRR